MSATALRGWLLVACAAVLATTGCRNVPGRPGPNSAVPRPEDVTDFKTLYSENCAACHGVEGKQGAAISLANPVYLGIAGVANLQHVTAAGVPGSLMPGFSKAAGGMLTDQQVEIIAEGMVSNWGNPGALGGQTAPPYASSKAGNAANGQQAYATYCARCHGADGTGAKVGSTQVGSGRIGSIVDPAYLALISDQGLRSIVIAGLPDSGMPDWRSDAPGHAMSDEEIGDVVAWLAAHRMATPGQPYGGHR
jgi:cytochrome c oxidase cbb3-type subunit 3/ubiquinol-cytochrome c reductase cytochrome c subunit